MTKEVLIHIKTRQVLRDMQEEEPDEMELITAGEYYFRNGTHYLLYEEVMEGFTEVTKNLVKVRPDFMEVRKKGTVDTTMRFERDKSSVSVYKTPFGVLQMDITTKGVLLSQREDLLQIRAVYELGMDGSPISDCVLYMRVTAKEDKTKMTFFS